MTNIALEKFFNPSLKTNIENNSETQKKMGIFKERRTSLPAMSIKVPEVEEVVEVVREEAVTRLDTEFVNKMATSEGVDILAQLEAGSCLARLEPCPGDRSLYCVRLASKIPAFKIKTSCAHR